MYEDWYTSARLGLLDHQTDWYYTPAKDEDKVSVIILNTGACQKQEIIPCHWLWKRFADCHENLSRRCGAPWQCAADGTGRTVKILAKDWITALCFGLHLFHRYHVHHQRYCKSPVFLSRSHFLSLKWHYSWCYHYSDNIHITSDDLFICCTARASYITPEVSPASSLFLGPGSSQCKVNVISVWWLHREGDVSFLNYMKWLLLLQTESTALHLQHGWLSTVARNSRRWNWSYRPVVKMWKMSSRMLLFKISSRDTLYEEANVVSRWETRKHTHCTEI